VKGFGGRCEGVARGREGKARGWQGLAGCLQGVYLEDVVLARRVELEEQCAATLLLVLDSAHGVRVEAREERAPLRDH
jgi:hypothetical protein